jgi:nitrous oxidase accessory protein
LTSSDELRIRGYFFEIINKELERKMKGIIFFSVLLFSLPFQLSGKVHRVSKSSELIADVITLASPHDTIIVSGGTYKQGPIIIDKPMTMIGEDYPVLDGELKNGVLTIKADSVWFEGFIIKNVSTSYIEDLAGIRVSNSSGFTIINNKLHNTFFGIFLEASDHGIVENNEVIGEAVDQYNSGNGIHLWQCNNITIINNHVSKHRDGIYFEFVDNSRIIGNRSDYNLRYGLHFMFSNHDLYERNIFEKNGAGVAVMFSKFINMYYNTFKDNWGQSSYGLLLKEIYDGELIGNTFDRNTIGINAEGSNRLIITNNTFIQNGWGIKVLGACFNNTISENNFMYNTFDVAYSGGLNENTFDKNYWSDYTGYDLDRDGVGDVPYRPVRLFTYVVNQVPESIILIRSLFVYLIDFSEKVSPIFTPDNLVDAQPKMLPY